MILKSKRCWWRCVCGTDAICQLLPQLEQIKRLNTNLSRRWNGCHFRWTGRYRFGDERVTDERGRRTPRRRVLRVGGTGRTGRSFAAVMDSLDPRPVGHNHFSQPHSFFTTSVPVIDVQFTWYLSDNRSFKAQNSTVK